MLIELSDEMVESVVVAELKWAFEHSFDKQYDGEVLADNADLRESLRDVILYFMPYTAALSYLKEAEEKYGH